MFLFAPFLVLTCFPTSTPSHNGQLTSNDTYFSDSWFSSVNTAEEMAAAGVDYCGPVKTIHKGFCLDTLEKLMKDWPGGSYLVLKSTPRFPGESPLLAIG